MHNFLTREGVPPWRVLTLGRREVRREGVELRNARVTDAARRRDGFVVLARGRRLKTRKLLIATGIRDHEPAIPALHRYVGCGVYYCAYCDGNVVANRPLVALGHGMGGADLALALTTWSRNVTYCTNGTPRPRGAICERLAQHGIAVRHEPIARLEGRRHLEAIVLRTEERLACGGLFVQEGHEQQSDLAARLGCDFTRRGAVRTRLGGRTNVPSVFVAGDAGDDVRAVVVAAAAGAKAAFAINQELREERCRLP